jgi:hypothetical protein
MTTTSSRLALLAVIILAWFGVFEASLRVAGSSEADPTFRNLFTLDPVIGYRLHPSTSIRYTTSSSRPTSRSTAPASRRRDWPEARGERRIVVLGDSLVLAVQVPLQQTFCKQLERRLNGRGGATHYRVINAGVQGYGPSRTRCSTSAWPRGLQPDLVVVVVFVANDAIEASDRSFRLTSGGLPVVGARREVVRNIRRVVRPASCCRSSASGGVSSRSDSRGGRAADRIAAC